jgi:molybdenum-dependent DNA-binding transcriptional regulator ModE
MKADKRERQAEFLEALLEYGTILRATQATGIPYGTVEMWMRKEARFKKAVREVRDRVTEDLESVAILRAKGGSDALLQFLLKAASPEKYRERSEVKSTHAVDKELKQLIDNINPSLGPPKKRKDEK